MNNRRNIMNKSIRNRALILLVIVICLVAASSRLRADTGTCSGGSTTLPFTDVPAANTFFCSIASAFYSGLTNGTSGTTYSPALNVTREQMAAFVSRTLEQSIRRNNLRAVTRKGALCRSGKRKGQDLRGWFGKQCAV